MRPAFIRMETRIFYKNTRRELNLELPAKDVRYAMSLKVLFEEYIRDIVKIVKNLPLEDE